MSYYTPEYLTCKAISTYLFHAYPNVLYHWDLSGLNHSKAQAGMNKAIQHGRGWPDLFIAEKRGNYSGLFLEIKAEGVRIQKRDGSFSTSHIAEQAEVLNKLNELGYCAEFACGWEQARKVIDGYLKIKV
jgi:hypothetical protein